jgi:hypothetical protein
MDEKRGVVMQQLIALVLTLGAVFFAMVALAAVAFLPIVISQRFNARNRPRKEARRHHLADQFLSKIADCRSDRPATNTQFVD